jgi:hypothetical protein
MVGCALVLVTHSVHTSNFPSLKILFKTLSLRAGAWAPRDLQRADIAFTLVSLAERHAKDTRLAEREHTSTSFDF